MKTKKKKLLTALLVFILFVLSGVAVAFSHELFETLPVSLALSSHSDKAPLLVAHRGLSSLDPENTIPAFKAAAEYGFDGYEFDVHTTKDGKWVVIHDDTLDRTTDGEGNVEDFTFEEIRKLKIDSGNGIEKNEELIIPTLDEALETAKENNIIPVIEIKKCDVRYLNGLIEILDSCGVREKTVIISFTKEYLEKYRELDSKAEILLLKGTPDEADVEWCEKYNCGLNFGYYNYYKSFRAVSLARKKGIKLAAWTVDNTAYLDVMVMAGVEIITTNKILP